MGILNDILNDEYNRLESLLDEYNKQLISLPNGSTSIKNIKGKNYCYLAYREGDKIKYKYVGKDESKKVKELKEKVRRRRKLKKKINEIKFELQEVKRVLNGRKRKKI